MNSANDTLERVGFPIRKSPDQSLFADSPKLIAGYYVLHRLLLPRHPPYALNSLDHITPNSFPSGAILYSITHILLPSSIYQIFKEQYRQLTKIVSLYSKGHKLKQVFYVLISAL